jgi:o-succinylbenzoate---CoA ligase
MKIIYHCSQNYQKQVEAIIEKWLREDTFFEIQTSGSTGNPKNIQLKRSLMEISAKMTAQAFDLQTGDTAFCCLNVAYIAGLMMVIRALVLDLELIVLEPTANPLATIEIDPNKKVFYAFVPLQIERIIEENPEKLQNAKAIIVGGTAVGAKLLQKIEMLEIPVYATYSMTETITHVAIRPLNGNNKSNLFTPLQNVVLALDDRNCLKIKAPVTENEWIVTNDIVRFQENGFELLGRIDNVINSGGLKIQAEKIETLIEAFLPNQRFFVSGLPDEKLGQKVSVFIEGKTNENIVETLKLHLSVLLNKFEIPKGYFFIDKFTETPTGKIDKNKTLNSLYF